MATVYAYSEIRHGEPDGTVKVFQPGDKLVGLDKELVARYLKRGTASTYDVTKSSGDQVQEALAEQDELRSKIAELEAKLAEATKAQTGPSEEDLKVAEQLTGTKSSSSEPQSKAESTSSAKK